MFELVEALDSRPRAGEDRYRLGPEETAGEALEALQVRGAELLAATLDGLEADVVVPKPQPADGVTPAPN